MDFKARFEGKKSFINKRGDIVDNETKNVTALRKPLQQQSIEPGATVQQPYMMFMNQKNFQDTQQQMAEALATNTTLNSGTFNATTILQQQPQQQIVRPSAIAPGSSPIKLTRLKNKDNQLSMTQKVQNFNSMTPGPATTTGSKAMQILLPDDKATEFQTQTPQRGMNTGHALEGSAKSRMKEKRVSVYANMAQKSAPDTDLRNPQQQLQLSQMATNSSAKAIHQVIQISPKKAMEVLVTTEDSANESIDKDQKPMNGENPAPTTANSDTVTPQSPKTKQIAGSDSPTAKRIRKILAPQFNLGSKRTGLNVIRTKQPDEPSQSPTKRKVQVSSNGTTSGKIDHKNTPAPASSEQKS